MIAAELRFSNKNTSEKIHFDSKTKTQKYTLYIFSAGATKHEGFFFNRLNCDQRWQDAAGLGWIEQDLHRCLSIIYFSR